MKNVNQVVSFWRMVRLLTVALWTLLSISLSGGQIFAVCDGPDCPSECTPEQLYVDIKPLYRNEAGNVVFCCRIAGKALEETGTGNWASITLKQVKSTEDYNVFSVGLNDGVACVTGDGRLTTSLYPTSGDTYGFYTVTYIWTSMPSQLCGCTSDTIWLTVPAGPVIHDDPELPMPAELGKMNCGVGDPINVSNGNMFTEETDASIGSDRGMPLKFTRYYNSYGYYSSRFGYKWTHSFEYELVVGDGGVTVLLQEGTGRGVLFRQVTHESGAVTYEPPSGIHYRLDYDDLNDIYTVTTHEDIKYVFSPDRRLWYIEDLNANRIMLYYGSLDLDSVVDASGRGIKFNYNANGRISELRTTSGNLLAIYTYNATTGNLESSAYPNGDYTTYTYRDDIGSGTFLTTISTHDGETGLYESGSTGVTTRNYDYDENGRAVESSLPDDVNAVLVPFYTVCDSCPQLSVAAASSPSGGEGKTHYSFMAPDSTRRMLYKVENQGCPSCGSEFGYDANGNLDLVTYDNGVQDKYIYDSRSNMITYTRASNTSYAHSTYYSYHSTYNLPVLEYSPSLANPTGRDSVVYEYGADANLDSLISKGWLNSTQRYFDITRFIYNSYGQLLKIDGSRSDVADTTSFIYYENGDLHYVIQANGDTTELGPRDALGNVSWVLDPNHVTTRYSYDERGQLDTVVKASGTLDSAVTAFTHNAMGDVTSVTFPEGNRLTYNFDNHHWLKSMVDAVGDSLVFEYDARSNLIRKEVKAADGTLKAFEDYTYYADDQLQRIINADGSYTEFEYDEMHNMLSKRDPNGNYTFYRYDELNRLDTSVQHNGTDSLYTAFFYDIHDRLTKLIDPDSNIFIYRYDDRGFLTADSSVVTGLTTYSYDAAGNLLRKINAAADTTGYTYDNLNRLTQISYRDPTQNTYFVYDNTVDDYGRGRLYQEITPACTATYQYDIMGQVWKDHKRVNGWNYLTTYKYDKNGEVDTIIPPSTHVISYTRDAARRVTSVAWTFGGLTKILASSIQYMPFGGAASWIYGNGINQKVTYDYSYRTDSMTTLNANTVKRAYTYDPSGNITGIRNLVDTTRNVTYGYDNLNQLASATSLDYPSGSLQYVYGRDGNRLKEIMGLDTSAYLYENNRLTAILGADTTIFRYDALGNITYDSTAGRVYSYHYDYAGRLVAVDSGDTEDYAQYYYDARNLRVRKLAGNYNRYTVYGQSGEPIEYRGTNGEWLYNLVYLNGQLLALVYPTVVEDPTDPTDPKPGGGNISSVRDAGQSDGGDDDIVLAAGGGGGGETVVYTFVYYHLDHLGTPLAITDASKNIQWSADYYPFGSLYDEQLSVPNDVRFPGQWHDRETDLYYNWHRYYGPHVGRYYQPDPLGFAAGDANLYRYVGNRPTYTTDRRGLYGFDVHWLMTYKLAREAGLTVSDALDIADINEQFDYQEQTDPFNYPEGTTYHFQQYNGYEMRTNLYNWARAYAQLNDLQGFASVLHQFQDTYSHEGYMPEGGHLWDSAMDYLGIGGKDPDEYDPCNPKDEEMTRRTKELLDLWRLYNQ